MKKEKENLSRRTFLAAGSAAVASSVIATETKAATTSKEVKKVAENTETEAMLLPHVGDPVYEGDTQTLTNKTISGRENTIINIGTEYINVKSLSSFPSSGTDITDALDDAIALISSSPAIGGQILIPQGVWTSNGGHDFSDSISIEGVGANFNLAGGTEIQMNSGSGEDYMFGIGGGNRRNCSLKNMTVNLSGKPSTTGLLMSLDGSDIYNKTIYGTYLENVIFTGGAYGIRVVLTAATSSSYKGIYSPGTTYHFHNIVLYGSSYYTCNVSSTTSLPTNTSYWSVHSVLGSFECILNVFNRVTLGCKIGFYCDTNNSGFEFNSPYISLPSGGSSTNPSVGFFCYLVGTLTVNNYLAVSPTINPTDGTTLLYTVGMYNNIVFQNGGQDENIEYLYRNFGYAFPVRPIVFRNCLVQSKVNTTADTSFVSDSNTFVNFVGTPTFSDTSTGYCKLYLMGKNGVETRNSSQVPQYGSEAIAAFTNSNSAIIDPFSAPYGY